MSSLVSFTKAAHRAGARTNLIKKKRSTCPKPASDISALSDKYKSMLFGWLITKSDVPAYLILIDRTGVVNIVSMGSISRHFAAFPVRSFSIFSRMRWFVITGIFYPGIQFTA